MINRNLTTKIIKALNNFRIVSINGPRQSGKTTVVKFIADQKAMNYITFDDQQKLHLALEDPKNFIKYYAKKPIVIDEVQLVPQIIPEIKTLVDEQNNKGMFLLTGSADILKMQKVTESLAGRIVRYNLYPLSNAEIQNKNNNLIDQLFQDNFFDIDFPSCKFELEQILAFIIRGGYPEMIGLIVIGSIIENYVYAELLKFSTYSKQSINIYHFRDLKKNEVDLVLENRDGEIIGIEVKAK